MSRVQRLLDAVRKLHEATPELMAYAPWPDDLSAQQVMPHPCPVAQTMGDRKLPGSRSTRPVIQALRAATPDLEWRQTYSEAEVGAEFLQTYGYVELFGPGGHFRSRKLRGYIGFWGPGLTYDWHAHEAEELYFTLSGNAVFCAHGAPNVMLRTGQARAHHSNQPHLMVTLDRPYLAYAVWRGAGMEGLPKMVAS
ncbi:dimethylsulfonioproprionate lyase family protein [Shimia ponticola]|uniref:dimethylsulfonioproprionate lyase family protein n=1 Tax=Shimia ponticola TaxID=2582893 RepID=UPI0011BF20FA|nr:dimethylsulfonioproprionate lyase family protein [Shimia ponticola]